MIIRKELKTDAKKVLKGKYWPFFIVGLMQYVIVSLLFIGVNEGNFQSLKAGILYTMILSLSMLIVQVFLINPFRAAYSRFMVVNSQNEETDYQVIWTTLKENYVSILKATFMRDLLITVCAVPFYIGIGLMGIGLIPYFMNLNIVEKLMAFQSFFSPATVMTTFYYMVFFVGCVIAACGFILLLYRAYSYRMVDFLVNDMPDASWEDVLLASKKMMKRNKFFTLTLDVSFFGWIILISLVGTIPVLFGWNDSALFTQIGLFFLYPYIDATMTQLYLLLKNKDNIQN